MCLVILAALTAGCGSADADRNDLGWYPDWQWAALEGTTSDQSANRPDTQEASAAGLTDGGEIGLKDASGELPADAVLQDSPDNDTAGIPDVQPQFDLPADEVHRPLADTSLDIASDLVLDTAPDLPDLSPQCTPSGSTDPCDGVDNDCDGVTDEDPGCDDGNGCNGVEWCDSQVGACQGQPPPACPNAPEKCNQVGGSDSATAGKLKSTLAEGFRMYEQKTWDDKATLIEELKQHWSVVHTPLADVLVDLNRVAEKITSVPGVPCFHSGFTWNSGDNLVEHWYPQGLSGTATAYPSGDYAGRKVAIVSWYHKPEDDPNSDKNKGVRISFVDTTGMSDLHYRHALLVEPVWVGATASYQAVKVHAGGIAWWGNYLFAADTTKGVRIFDLEQILKVQTGDKDSLGWQSEAKGYQAYNYRYVVPQVASFALCAEACCARFSFIALDLSTDPPSMLSGEYSVDEILGRVVRWPLAPNTGTFLVTDGAVHAAEAVFPGIKKLQGALSWDGDYFFSSSQPKVSWPPSPGSLHHGTLGQNLHEHTFPYPPEDLHYSKFSGNLWGLTEKAGTRYVFSMKKLDILNGCGE